MAAICSANTQCNVLYLIDTRPKVNTMMNRAQGKGTESEKHYANLRHHSFDIENIHVMRTSLNKLVEGRGAGDRMWTCLQWHTNLVPYQRI
jgi:myotubularin-related protein 6/7/8